MRGRAGAKRKRVEGPADFILHKGTMTASRNLIKKNSTWKAIKKRTTLSLRFGLKFRRLRRVQIRANKFLVDSGIDLTEYKKNFWKNYLDVLAELRSKQQLVSGQPSSEIKDGVPFRTGGSSATMRGRAGAKRKRVEGPADFILHKGTMTASRNLIKKNLTRKAIKKRTTLSLRFGFKFRRLRRVQRRANKFLVDSEIDLTDCLPS